VRFLVSILVLVMLPTELFVGSARADERPEAKFSLVDSAGNRVSEASYRGRFMLVAFGYTFCPDVCPTTLQAISLVLDDLGEAAKDVQPVFISIDPARDTPEIMGRYVAHFHPDIVGLTGSGADVAAAAEAFGATFKKVPRAGGNYLMDHSAYIDLFDRSGGYVYSFAYDDPIEKIVAITRKHMAGGS
jgi:cytochrome oxidase Cu insertion factor (SCO1/SenC/PrrC family)